HRTGVSWRSAAGRVGVGLDMRGGLSGLEAVQPAGLDLAYKGPEVIGGIVEHGAARLGGVAEGNRSITLDDLNAFCVAAEAGSAPGRLDRLPNLFWWHGFGYFLERGRGLSTSTLVLRAQQGTTVPRVSFATRDYLVRIR